jgi:zeaxanthin glucosyltransferase
LRLLTRASVCLTHAGLNAVLDRWLKAFPQVAIPAAVDQPGVAARIAEKGTGLFVPLKQLTADRVASLLDQVLTDDIYHDRSRYLEKIIAERNVLSEAADVLENVFNLANSRNLEAI